jgi:large subunit ribosomal protein L6
VSRIGRLPVVLPQGVEVQIDGSMVHVKGPKGEMQQSFPPSMQISINEGVLEVARATDGRTDRSLHGMTRALINNMVVGVSTGFERILEVNGVGYRAKIKGYDKQMVGQVAADIRKVRPPEPYQGKGIKYLEEKIRRKAGKAGKV